MYAIAITGTLHKRVMYATPADAHQNLASDPHRAAQFPTRRAAFARAMYLDHARMLPRGAVVDVVPATWEHG